MLLSTDRQAGASDVLSIEDVAAPEPGPGEVLVRLRLAGTDPSDGKLRASVQPDGFQIPGQDGAGEIVEVGEGGDPSRIGERVWVWV